ncbi:sulfite exporter TauE/SafE family protein [Patescibacteria group bacterium]|nr:sulfite exporter TauE/SafE family protein [Patescibacteria group bacterium]
MDKTEIQIKGMHCSSCEILVEDELLAIPGVNSAKVNYREGKAQVCHEGRLDHGKISRAIQKAGYAIGKDQKPFFSRNIEDYKTFGIAASSVFIIWYILSSMNVFGATSVASNNYSSLPIVFLVGLTAGISTCMAIVGGLVLGASARFAEAHPRATGIQKFTPHIFFNIGRIATFFILGGLMGMAGSIFQLSSSVLGILTIGIGLVMLSLGIQLIDLFPRLSAIKFTIPKVISRVLGVKSSSEKAYSHRNSMVLGGLTFFLPCGFTQAMQLFAMSSGSFWSGSLTMGIFALGTAPGLLGIGGLTSVVKGAFANIFFKFAGIVLIALAFFNISNGYNLTGIVLPSSFASSSPSAQVSDPNVTIENGTQIVRMKQVSSGYQPNSFTIKKGMPVKWVVESVDPYSCASSLLVPSLGIRQGLSAGENIFEFTPKEVGQIKFSCSMGMYTGSFNVVDDIGQVGSKQEAPQAGGAGSCGSSGGCGCGGGAKKPQAQQQPPVAAIQEGEEQVFKIEYTRDLDIQPNTLTVKKGVPVRIEIEAKEDGAGCMSSIMIPRLVNTPQLLTQGKTITFNFTPKEAGEFPITCGMGMQRGVLQVN